MDLKNASLKQKLVLVLGIAYVLFLFISDIFYLTNNAPLLYLASTFVQYTSMAAGMILITFRKKTPALILTVFALALCLINQYALTYGGVDPIWCTLYYLLEDVLLIAYILLGDNRKRNSLLWCGLFIFSVGYSVYEVLSFFSVRDLVFILLYLSFYLTGYSPDRWYERKDAKA